jgi:hypothetical protein
VLCRDWICSGCASIWKDCEYASGKLVMGEVYLLYPRPQETPNKKFEPLQLCLYDDQLEVRLGVLVARLVFDKFNLAA